MRISKKSEYAVRALVKMAQRAREGVAWHQIAQIAEATQIPEKFLEQILLSLKNEGFVKSRRGIGGGYSLNLPEKDITLDNVILALEGPQFFAVTEKVDENSELSVLTEALSQAVRALRSQLQSQDLSRLVNEMEARNKNLNRFADYQI